jgi:hypothetical protein
VGDHFEQANDGQAGGIHHGFDTGGAQTRSGTAEEAGIGKRGAEFVHYQRGV